MDTLTLFKLLATPVAILCCVLLTRRWGAFVGSLFGGLPTLSGPISFFLTWEQGADFSARASYNSLLGIAACSATAIIYPWMAAKGFSWFWSLVVAILGFFIAGGLLHYLPESLPLAVCLAAAAAPVVVLCLPKNPGSASPPKRQVWWMLPFQLAYGAFMVYGVSETAHIMGPQWSGTVMTFPIMICALAPFTHASSGVPAVLLVIKGLLTGWIGCVAFGCVIIFFVHEWSMLACYSLAALCAMVTSLVVTICLKEFKLDAPKAG